MSNIEKNNINNEKQLTQHNEEETTTVEIDEITDLAVDTNTAQIKVPENNERSNHYLNEKKYVQNLDTELENVIIKTNELEQKSTAFHLVEYYPKLPSVWVQYNQLYGRRIPHQQYGGDSGQAALSYNPGSRNYFVKFVFMVLFVMLAITAVYGILVLTKKSLKEFYQDSGFLMIILSSVVLLAMNYVMACSACARVPPCNFISLFIVVIAMSNLVAAITVRYDTNIIVMALIATLITVALCIILACSSFDFTAWYIYVVVIGMVFMAISMVASIAMLAMGLRFKPLQIFLLIVGTLLQVVILIMELQMILGGKTIEIGEEDYALAAYLLYTSIIDIFLHLIQLLGLLEE